MKFIGTHFEVLISVVFLWISESIFWTPTSYFSKTSQSFDASDPVAATVHTALLVFLVIACVVRRHQMLTAVAASWLIVLLIGLAFLSALWAPAPELVLRRASTLAITTLFAIYLAARFEIGRLAAILVKINACAIVASIILLIVAPALASGANMEYPNAIRGAYGSKNTLGGISAMGIIIGFYAWRGHYGPRLLSAAVIPGNLALLYVSQSATAIIITLAGIYAAMVGTSFHRRDAVGFITGFLLLVAGLAVMGLLAIGWQDLLALLNRSPTMTGRLPIWRLTLYFIGQRPWLGYGYGAFWRHDGIEAQTYWSELHWMVPHAHNGLLENGLALGSIGIAWIIILWIAVFYRTARLLPLATAEHVAFCLSLLAGVLIENLTEYEFLRADSIFWVFFVVVYTHLGLELARERRRRVTVPDWPARGRANRGRPGAIARPA